jgi:hypothetical protein
MGHGGYEDELKVVTNLLLVLLMVLQNLGEQIYVRTLALVICFVPERCGIW